METSLITQLSAILALFLGDGALRWYYTRKESRKIMQTQNKAGEWQIYKEQLEAEREHVRFKDERIKELMEMNRQKEDRFVEQTQRLRDTQARELQANEERIKAATQMAEANARVAELERQNGELRLRLQKGECVKLGCIQRDPPNEYTRKAIEELKNEQKNESE